MSIYSLVDPDTGRTFKITGSASLTETRAREIFNSQRSAGSLVGLKPGQRLDAASQALGGLNSAQSQLGALTGDAGGLARQALGKVSDLTGNLPVTNGITAADFSLTAPALTGIDQVTPTQVKATLAQAEKLTGQDFSLVTDNKGLGKYGFSVDQLETAGVVKSGTAAKFVAQGANPITDVLKSPSVFTGKNGINSQSDLLGSVSKQDLVQTGLMVAGVAGLKSNGVPTQLMGAAALAGSALVAAKGVDGALDWVQGKLPAVPSANLDALARDGAFAAGFADSKISDAMAQEFPALPAVDTVDRATLNAAAGRVLGNDKIPDLNFSVSSLPRPSELQARLGEINSRLATAIEDFGFVSRLNARRRPAEIQSDAVGIYNDIQEVERIVSELYQIKSELLSVQREAEAQDPPASAIVSQAESSQVASVTAQAEALLEKIRQQAERNSVR